jgi:beta-glucanase (GH16 family)
VWALEPPAPEALLARPIGWLTVGRPIIVAGSINRCSERRGCFMPARRRQPAMFETLEQRQFMDALPGTYHLTFDDEFNTLQLSTYNSSGNLVNTNPSNSGWLTRDAYDDAGYNEPAPGNAEQEYYVNPAQEPATDDNPFSINHGILSINANKTPADMVGAQNIYNGLTQEPYTSGMLTTAQGDSWEPYNQSNGFSQTYGYFEMRCEVPNSPGMWPAFWLLPEPKLNTSNTNAEYDIFEIPVSSTYPSGENTKTIYQTSHLNGPGVGQNIYTLPNGGDASTSFHTYGFEWDSTSIRWYVDGVLTATMPNVCNTPMYVLLNLAVGGTWPGNAIPADLPQTFKIDYVRAYSSSSSVPEITPQSGYSVNPDTLDAISVDPEPATAGVVLAGLIYLAGQRPRGERRRPASSPV